MPEELGGQLSKIIIKAIYVGLITIILVILVTLFGVQTLDTHKTQQANYQSNIIESCFNEKDEFGYYKNEINLDKITSENLRKCAKGTKITLTDLNDKEILSIDTQDEGALKIPLCEVNTKDFSCITKRSYILLKNNKEITPAYLTIEMVAPK